MKDSHEGVEHLRGDSLVDVLILLVVHVFASAASNSATEETVSKLFDFILIIHSIFVINILSFVVLV